MKAPRFFCDNCGEEVSRDHDACPRCGRFFSSVRCPNCGFAGEDKLFANGCPECGYSAVKIPRLNRKKPESFVEKKRERLPFWVYIISFFVMIMVMMLLLMVIL